MNIITFKELPITEIKKWNLSSYQQENTILFLHYFISLVKFNSKENFNRLNNYSTFISKIQLEKFFGKKSYQEILNILKEKTNFTWLGAEIDSKFYDYKNGVCATYIFKTKIGVVNIDYNFRYKKIINSYEVMTNRNVTKFDSNNKQHIFLNDMEFDVKKAETVCNKLLKNKVYKKENDRTIDEQIISYKSKLHGMLDTIKNFDEKKFTWNVDNFAGRKYNIMGNMKSELRDIVKSKSNQELLEVDIKNSHLNLLSQIFNINFELIGLGKLNNVFEKDETLFRLFENKIDVYLFLVKKWNETYEIKVDRDIIKNKVLRFIFGDNVGKNFTDLFEKEFPITIKNINRLKFNDETEFNDKEVSKCLNQDFFIRTKYYKDSKTEEGFIINRKSVALNWILQKLELEIFLNPLKNIEGYSIHDSFKFYKKDKKQVIEIINKSFENNLINKKLFIKPNLKITK